jgi:hypothetical protein
LLFCDKLSSNRRDCGQIAGRGSKTSSGGITASAGVVEALWGARATALSRAFSVKKLDFLVWAGGRT